MRLSMRGHISLIRNTRQKNVLLSQQIFCLRSNFISRDNKICLEKKTFLSLTLFFLPGIL